MNVDPFAAATWTAFRRPGPLAPDWNIHGLNLAASLFSCPVMQEYENLRSVFDAPMPLLPLYLHSLMHAAPFTDNVQPPHTMPQISERLHALRVIGVRAPIMCSHIDGHPKLPLVMALDHAGEQLVRLLVESFYPTDEDRARALAAAPPNSISPIEHWVRRRDLFTLQRAVALLPSTRLHGTWLFRATNAVVQAHAFNHQTQAVALDASDEQIFEPHTLAMLRYLRDELHLDLNARDDVGDTPLCAALRRAVAMRANPPRHPNDAANFRYFTPLVLQALLDCGADPSARDDIGGETPLALAARIAPDLLPLLQAGKVRRDAHWSAVCSSLAPPPRLRSSARKSLPHDIAERIARLSLQEQTPRAARFARFPTLFPADIGLETSPEWQRARQVFADNATCEPHIDRIRASNFLAQQLPGFQEFNLSPEDEARMQEDFLERGWMELVEVNDTRPVQDFPPEVQRELRTYAIIALERAVGLSAREHARTMHLDLARASQNARAAVLARYPFG